MSTFFFMSPYPWSTVHIHNVLFVTFDFVEQLIRKPVMYRHCFLGVGGCKACLSDDICCTKSQLCDWPSTLAERLRRRVVIFYGRYIATDHAYPQFWTLFKKCHGKGICCE